MVVQTVPNGAEPPDGSMPRVWGLLNQANIRIGTSAVVDHIYCGRDIG